MEPSILRSILPTSFSFRYFTLDTILRSYLPSYVSIFLLNHPFAEYLLHDPPYVAFSRPLQLRKSDMYLSATTRIIVGGETTPGVVEKEKRRRAWVGLS